MEDADAPFADYRQDLKRKSQYARASDPEFLSEPRPYKKVRLEPHLALPRHRLTASTAH